VTSNLNLRLAVNDVMLHFLIWSQRLQFVINYVFLTITFETGLLINVSQHCIIPFTTSVSYYPSSVLLPFLHTSDYNLSVLH